MKMTGRYRFHSSILNVVILQVEEKEEDPMNLFEPSKPKWRNATFKEATDMLALLPVEVQV